MNTLKGSRMSEKLEQAETKYNELVNAVQVLTKKITEFRRLYEPEAVDFDEISGLLHNMLGEIDEQLIEENL
jgi:archaellum component FlaC